MFVVVNDSMTHSQHTHTPYRPSSIFLSFTIYVRSTSPSLTEPLLYPLTHSNPHSSLLIPPFPYCQPAASSPILLHSTNPFPLSLTHSHTFYLLPSFLCSLNAFTSTLPLSRTRSTALPFKVGAEVGKTKGFFFLHNKVRDACMNPPYSLHSLSPPPLPSSFSSPPQIKPSHSTSSLQHPVFLLLNTLSRTSSANQIHIAKQLRSRLVSHSSSAGQQAKTVIRWMGDTGDSNRQTNREDLDGPPHALRFYHFASHFYCLRTNISRRKIAPGLCTRWRGSRQLSTKK